MNRTRTAVVVALAGALAPVLACDRLEALRGRPTDASAGPPPVDSTEVAVPPVAQAGMPLVAFADGAALEPSTGTPYEQAIAYESSGQLWHARLVLEKQALGADASPRETELLAKVCAGQGDVECITVCEQRLGRKLRLDAGAGRGGFDAGRGVDDGSSDAARAQRMVLRGDPEGARKLLQPKLVGKTISGEELAVLRMACERQRDTLCVLACDGASKR